MKATIWHTCGHSEEVLMRAGNPPIPDGYVEASPNEPCPECTEIANGDSK